MCKLLFHSQTHLYMNEKYPLSSSNHFSIEKENLEKYLIEQYNPRIRKAEAEKKPWLPAEKLIQEMRECLYFRYISATDKNHKEPILLD